MVDQRIVKTMKNPEAPGGREDWKGRSPRWRLSLTNAQLSLLIEWAETHFNKLPGDRVKDDQSELYERLIYARSSLATPLMQSTYEAPIFDDLEEMAKKE